MSTNSVLGVGSSIFNTDAPTGHPRPFMDALLNGNFSCCFCVVLKSLPTSIVNSQFAVLTSGCDHYLNSSGLIQNDGKFSTKLLKDYQEPTVS